MCMRSARSTVASVCGDEVEQHSHSPTTGQVQAPTDKAGVRVQVASCKSLARQKWQKGRAGTGGCTKDVGVLQNRVTATALRPRAKEKNPPHAVTQHSFLHHQKISMPVCERLATAADRRPIDVICQPLSVFLSASVCEVEAQAQAESESVRSRVGQVTSRIS